MVKPKAGSRVNVLEHRIMSKAILLCSILIRSLFFHLHLNAIKEDGRTCASFAVAAPEIDYIMLLQQLRDNDLIQIVLVISYDSNGSPESHVQHLE